MQIQLINKYNSLASVNAIIRIRVMLSKVSKLNRLSTPSSFGSLNLALQSEPLRRA